MKSQWVFILKLLISLCLIGLVLFYINFRQLISEISNANLWYLLSVAVLIYCSRVLMAYKWSLLLRAVRVRVPFFFLFRTYLTAPLAGVLLPSTIGGDLFRLYSLSRHKANTRAVTSSIVVERVIGFSAVLVMAAFSLGLVSSWMRASWPRFTGTWWALVIGAVLVSGLLGMMHNAFRERMSRIAGRFTESSMVSKLYRVYLMCCEYRNHLHTITVVSAWTLVEQMVTVIANLFLVRAFYINVSLFELIAIIPLIVLAIRLPISFEGIGVQEGLYIALFGLVGVSASEAFLLSMVARVLVLLCALPWGIYYVMADRQAVLPEQQFAPVKPQEEMRSFSHT